MHSRPLLDYLAYPEEFADAEPVALAPARRPVIDPLEARLKDIEARLRPNDLPSPTPTQDLTLSAQIEAILKRKAAVSPPAGSRRGAPLPGLAEQPGQPTRVVIAPPPTVPASNDVPAVDEEFAKFSEAVYLIGQAAKRFIEQPQLQSQVHHARLSSAASRPTPSASDVEALSAVLRETVSAFRSVADDLAVSAGEIRHYATREERMPPRRPQPARCRDDDEIIELRESIADLQDRLDDLLHARRRRY